MQVRAALPGTSRYTCTYRSHMPEEQRPVHIIYGGIRTLKRYRLEIALHAIVLWWVHRKKWLMVVSTC